MNASCIMMGTNRFAARSVSTPSNPAWATPMTVSLRLLTISVVPTTSRFPANRCFQKRQLSTASGSPFGTRSSSGMRVRPNAGCTPRTLKYVPETSSTRTRSASPPKERLAEVLRRTNMPENTSL